MTICTPIGQQSQQQSPTSVPAAAAAAAAAALDEVATVGANDDPKSQVSLAVTTEACNIPNCVACNGQEECLSCVAPFYLDRKRVARESCVARDACSQDPW